jgi:hypothetical protein
MVSSPVPQPVPSYIRKSTPELSRKQTLVVGLPKSVAGEGKVHVSDRASGITAIVPAPAAGSFVAILAVGVGADLEVRYESRDGLSEPVSLNVRSIGDHPALTPSYAVGVPVSSPDAQGQVTVTNDAGPGNPLLFLATPQSEVLVSNASSGAATSAVTDQDGRFQVKLPGAQGDMIQVLLAARADSALTSDFLTYAVP